MATSRRRRVKRLKAQGDSTWLEIVLTEGKNREIRRMLARLGHKVMRLRRTAIGPIELGSTAARQGAALKVEELERLRRRAREPSATSRPERTATSRADAEPIAGAMKPT